MNSSSASPYTTLAAAELAASTPPARWLLDGLFPWAGAGILGGAPKSMKSFFALEMTVAVASGTACAGHFSTLEPGPVLLLCAEDPAAVLLERLAALAHARSIALGTLPIHIIVEPNVKLPGGLQRLAATVDKLRPRLLVLDPLIRLHNSDENSSQEMSTILDGLRALARASSTAILLVHHMRKASSGAAVGNGLRGSSDLWAFGDSNLYVRRLGSDPLLELRLEHRCAVCPPPLRLRLRVETNHQGPKARFLLESKPQPDPLAQRTMALLARKDAPTSTAELRHALGVRKQVLLDLLRELARQGRARRVGREGWVALTSAVPVPSSIGRNRNPVESSGELRQPDLPDVTA